MAKRPNKKQIEEALEGRTVMDASRILKMPANTLRKRMKIYGIQSDPQVLSKFRTEHAKKVLRKGPLMGEDNPNWKGGISKNKYHYKKIQMQRYPERVSARNKLSQAVRQKRILRQPCEVCGCNESFAHHEDYSKPLDVKWLCRPHHRDVHAGRH